MKIIQKDFKVASRIWFLLFLGLAPSGVFCMLDEVNNTTGRLIFNVLFAIFATWLMGCGAYIFSFAYEFKQKELVACSLFSFWKKESHSWESLREIQFRVNQVGYIDTITLYFECKGTQRKFDITKYQADPGRVRLFLKANVENFEELVTEVGYFR